jgi:hypothetical protein
MRFIHGAIIIGLSTQGEPMKKEYQNPKDLSKVYVSDQVSTLVGVTRLVQEDLLLEVEVVAAVADQKTPAKKKKR